MILTGEGRAGEIAQVERFDLVGPDIGVMQRLFTGLYGQEAKVTVRENAKRGFSYADNGNGSHNPRLPR